MFEERTLFSIHSVVATANKTFVRYDHVQERISARAAINGAITALPSSTSLLILHIQLISSFDIL